MSRLKVVLASDRTGLDEITMAKIRGEIQAVVAKYLVINENDVSAATAKMNRRPPTARVLP